MRQVKEMKRYIALLLCLITVFSICSCNIYEKLLPVYVLLEPTIHAETTPSETTTKSQETTIEPQETTTEPQETTTEPQETTTEPQETTPESGETTAPETESATPEFTYLSFLNGNEKVLIDATRQYSYLGDYVPTTAGKSLAKCETLRYIYYDVDGNGIQDVAIDCGSEKLYLTCEDGIVTLKTLSAKIWEKIEAEDDWYPDILPLGAPWREVLLSREEIEDIASHVWQTMDGEGDGACGTYYIWRIVVSDEANPNGYYLVTRKYEAYKWCDREECTEAEGTHRHLYKIKDFDYMLVHQETGDAGVLKITPNEAYQHARVHWNTYDGYVGHAAGTTYVHRINIEGKPQYILGEMYYYVVLRIEYYSNEGYQNGADPEYIYDSKHLYVHARTGECYPYPSDGK